MGMMAVYLSVEPGEAERLAEVDPDEIVDYVESVQASGVTGLDLDKLWDGLHFLLTGASATEPIEDDPLSEAVVGVYEFDSEELVGVTPAGELGRIVDALEAVDIDRLLADANYARFAAADVYPNIWTDERSTLDDELRSAFTQLLGFSRECLANGRDILVSIY